MKKGLRKRIGSGVKAGFKRADAVNDMYKLQRRAYLEDLRRRISRGEVGLGGRVEYWLKTTKPFSWVI